MCLKVCYLVSICPRLL